MKLDKEEFFKIIDGDDHLNLKTREACWHFFSEKSKEDLLTLYQEAEQLFPDKTGLPQYVRYSISMYYDFDEEGKLSKKREESSAEQERQSRILPIGEDGNNETAITWGTNNDVKNK